MSYGLVICSECKREVHQKRRPYPVDDSKPFEWFHCEDQTPRCKGASGSFPRSKDEIAGKFCGRDDVAY